MRVSPIASTALLVSAILVCSACSTAPRSADAPDPDSKYVRTGSHIPSKDADGGFAKSQDVQSVQDEMRKSGGVGPIPIGR
jgi:hypothetical protein